MIDKFCTCANTITSDPCIVCGKPKLVTKEWMQKRASLEGDSEIGAGMTTEATPAPPAMEAEAVAWLGGDNEQICDATAMRQWEASLKRPDLAEKDRVRGALEAFKRQAIALQMLASPPKPDKGVVEALRSLVAMRGSIEADVSSAHNNRGNGASEWMREDDRDFRRELRTAFDAADAALAGQVSPASGRQG
ncbi:MAG: hypothetical protein EOR26_05245 [Mesorhizobium sp.]|uniref:hypothetical protein n=1 Tax=unclassified Mesorhizobium TaxID=325217 RepID=UPI000FCB1DA1|nr:MULTISPECIES: hypothetical protein [unclassified Mesorhizobium]RUV69679.1 hypothetical protein EOA78_22855 [Mesorhizobium sp. M5C.F.Cr.IN.023.01.1.1]RWI51101.1 MAG: hypothetical protein EOR15_06825 [Mesorhizobium sp.]RWI62087.1 MAG: hypothetical protein EOR16_04020 [Mesorhizobium sp.]RWJ13938.1 MAG: hypothetical protein EOR24_01280 [Mesorhizobium sp.]RWJ16837.1 MAG: hypothetical protein EOR25_13165 [Mesorhizobium sp.]